MKDSIKKHKDEYIHIKKIKINDLIPIVLICLAILVIGMVIYNLGLLLDNDIDKYRCSSGIKSITNESRCYANDDFFHYNFGHNIRCTCFYDVYFITEYTYD
jgi:hypothetical protein